MSDLTRAVALSQGASALSAPCEPVSGGRQHGGREKSGEPQRQEAQLGAHIIDLASRETCRPRYRLQMRVRTGADGKNADTEDWLVVEAVSYEAVSASNREKCRENSNSPRKFVGEKQGKPYFIGFPG